MSIPEHVIGVPPQADAVGHGAVPVGAPEGQQSVPLALRNQLESIVGDLRLAYSRLGQLPPNAIEPDTFSGLTAQYASLMDIAGQLTDRLNAMGPMIGEDLGLAKEVNRLQADIEVYIGAVESSIASMLAQPANGNGAQWDVQPGEAVLEPMPGQPHAPANGANGGAALAPGDARMRWGLVIGGLLLIAGGTYYYYRQQGVTPAF